MIQVNDTEIYIEAQFFVHKDYSFTGKELLMDIFAENYTNQQIRIYVHDGENLEFSGFLTFIEYIADTFKVPYNHITIESHGPTGIFKNKNLAPGIFLSTGWHIPAFVRDLSNAKFVGTTLGRFNPTRFRLAYEIDCAFPNDNYTVFQPKLTDIERNYRHVTTLYAKELSWIKSKTFDQDMQNFIGCNEIFQNIIVNRSLRAVYDAQVAIFNMLQLDVQTAPDLNIPVYIN